MKVIIKLEPIVSNVTHQPENSLIQSQSNAKNVLKAPNTVLALNPVNVTVPPQEESIQPPKHVNVLEVKSSLTMNAHVHLTNLFGTVKHVLPVHLELHMNQKTSNVIIAQKDLLLIQ